MASGGARNRSGPVAQEGSARSEQRGFKLSELPAAGFDGPVPEWPLGAASERELEVWEWAWSTPQACAWSLPSQQWRVPSVALWVRTRVRAEAPDATAAILSQLHRFADQVGMTTAGLAEMGWKIAETPAKTRATRSTTDAPKAPERRLRAV